MPKDWYCDSIETLRKECRLPEEKIFFTKSEIALTLINKVLRSGLLHVQWIGCDAAYGNDHTLLDGLELPNQVWYFVAANAKEQVFRASLSYPFLTLAGDAPENIRFFPRSRCLYRI